MERSRTPRSKQQLRTNRSPTRPRIPAAPKRPLQLELPARKPDRSAERAPSRKRRLHANGVPWESDAELVHEILSGSRDHFETLYRVYFPRVYRFALKRLGDPGEAEDVTQEVFMTVFRVLHTYAGNSSLLVWIFGITRNKVNRRFRGIRPRFEVIDGDSDPGIATKDVAVDRVIDARRMLERCEAVVQSELTPLQRRIFHLKHLRRQSIRSIAGALGKSEDAVKANLYRMRRAITRAAPGLDKVLEA